MLHGIARALQLIGLVMVPIAVAGNMAGERLSLKESLIWSFAGILVFSAGWVLQQRTRPR